VKRIRPGIAAALLCLAATTMAAAASWESVGSLIQANGGPVVTKLLDGTVLVTGGVANVEGEDVVSRVAERFDPQTHHSTAVSSMKVPRLEHQASLLPDGRVLVMGGLNSLQEFVSQESAEIFDPATGQFSPTGDLLEPRAFAPSVSLADGRVLIIGGWVAGNLPLLATSEVYDPTTGKFTRTRGSMSEPRSQHAAVALSDGRVVVAGGGDGQKMSQIIEIFDPATGKFATKGRIVTPRANPRLVRLPGDKALVIGGGAPSSDGEWRGLDSIELYDPATGRSAVIGRLSVPRYLPAVAALADGRILVAGGDDFKGTFHRTADLIDVAQGTVTPTAPMAEARSQAGVVSLRDGRVLVVGGVGAGEKMLGTVEVYNP
jgi:hypothetical protein